MCGWMNENTDRSVKANPKEMLNSRWPVGSLCTCLISLCLEDCLCPLGNKSIKLKLVEFLKQTLILIHGRFGVGHRLSSIWDFVQVWTHKYQQMGDKTLVIYFAFLQFNRASVDYPGKSVSFSSSDLHCVPARVQAVALHRRLTDT